VLPQAREACPHNLAPTTSSLMQLVLGDALAVALLEARGFTATQFGALHPGGRLGAMLKFVRHLMHTGEAVPRVRLGADIATAIAEMSAKGFGCAAVIDADGRLAGIVTDGDLRRHLARRIGGAADAARVDDVMTRTPKTIGADDLASEALERLNSAKITALLVVEDSTVVGILHLHDLLRAGVA
jgi:arabinose-5-phosphate isomerase